MRRIERVDAESVTRAFGPTLALRGVTLGFRAGEIAVLEGANGAGKSTLLAVLGTALAPSRGRVSFGAFGTDAQAARAEIGWVSHESRCYAELTARENVELTARLYGVDAAAAWERVSARVAAVALGGVRVGRLSRGQRQRIALARALVARASLLLLDEPWTGLDRATSALLDRVLLEEAAGGAIVVAVSHEPGVVERLAARRVELSAGRVVSEGSGGRAGRS